MALCTPLFVLVASLPPVSVVVGDFTGLEREEAERIATALARELQATLGAPVRIASAAEHDPAGEVVRLSIIAGPLRILIRAAWRRTEGGARGASATLPQPTSEWAVPIASLARALSEEMRPPSASALPDPQVEEVDRGSSPLLWTALGVGLIGGVAAAMLAGASGRAPGPPAIHSAEEHHALAPSVEPTVAAIIAGGSATSLVLAVVLAFVSS